MSDINIPGTSTSRFDTPAIVDKLMEAERIPLQGMEDQLDSYKTQKDLWNGLNKEITSLNTASRSLYGFENPFQEKVGTSSDESVLSATVTREASDESIELTVKQIAQADRFLSGSLPRDYTAPEGDYVFTLGDRDVTVRFRGGRLSALADTINQRSGGLVKASVVKDTATTQVLVLEGGKTGAGNTLGFEGQALDFALESGMMEPVANRAREFTPGTMQPKAWNTTFDASRTENVDGGLKIDPQTELSLPFSPKVESGQNLYLEIDVTLAKLAEEDYVPPPAPKGPDIPSTGQIEFEGVQIQSADSFVDLPGYEPPAPPENVTDMGILWLGSQGTDTALAPLKDVEQTQTIRVPLQDYPNGVDALKVRNRNTHREVTINAIRVVDEESRGDYRPANPASTARDAIIDLQGIEIVRDSNAVDDLLDGVTINLKKPDPNPVTLDVTPNRDLIKQKLIEFVGHYNQLMTEINILTSNDEAVIDEITYFDDDQIAKAKEKLGAFQGDFTLNSIKNAMRRIASDAYQTSSGRDLALLSQIGISTNSTGGGFNTTKLRGYLEINEDQLDQSLEGDMVPLKELFGSDSDGDLVVDQGLAYAMEQLGTAYTQTGGIIALKTGNLDSQISDQSDRIDDFKKDLADKEAEYKRQYGTMEGTIQGLEQSIQGLQNLNNNGQNN